jgi:hypothetical protein
LKSKNGCLLDSNRNLGIFSLSISSPTQSKLLFLLDIPKNLSLNFIQTSQIEKRI